MRNHRKIFHALHEYLHDQTHWKTIAYWLVSGVLLFCLVVWFGRDAVEEIKAAEDWIAGHGVLGQIVFVALIIVGNSLFIPLSVFSIAAGAIFGMVGGTLIVSIGALVTSAIDYQFARRLLRKRIETMLEQHPKLQAIQLAVLKEGLRLQILLRMGPISAASVSYVLGASGSRFSTFLLATIGLLPSIILNVYFGYAASHVTKAAGSSEGGSILQTVATAVGVVIGIAIIIVVTRVVAKALRQFDLESTEEASS